MTGIPRESEKRAKTKKVLILAYDFPPYVSVGGIRPYNWYKYLSEHDVYPTVVTRQWANEHGNHLDYISPGSSNQNIIKKDDCGIIIQSPYKPNLSNRLLLKYGDNRFRLIRKTISAFYEFGQFLFPIGPKKEVYRSAKNYLSENKVDAIIATGDPFVLFHYAKKLSKQFNTPWIADYRDPWSHDIHIKRNKLFHLWSRTFEKRTVKSAKKIITVNEVLASQIRGLVKNVEISIIPNGFNPDSAERARETPQRKDILTITFVGRIYEWYPIESFLSIFSEVTQTHKIALNFYGLSDERQLRELIQKNFPEIQDLVSIHPKLPNEELLKKIANDHLMLLFNNYTIMGTKIFDYLGVQRKILFCYRNDAEAQNLKDKYFKLSDSGFSENRMQEDVISKTNSGVIAEDASHLREILLKTHAEFEANRSIKCKSQNIAPFSRKIQVKHLAELIKSIN